MSLKTPHNVDGSLKAVCLQDMPQTTTYDEKRVIVIGIATLIADATPELYSQP